MGKEAVYHNHQKNKKNIPKKQLLKSLSMLATLSTITGAVSFTEANVQVEEVQAKGFISKKPILSKPKPSTSKPKPSTNKPGSSKPSSSKPSSGKPTPGSTGTSGKPSVSKPSNNSGGVTGVNKPGSNSSNKPNQPNNKPSKPDKDTSNPDQGGLKKPTSSNKTPDKDTNKPDKDTSRPDKNNNQNSNKDDGVNSDKEKPKIDGEEYDDLRPKPSAGDRVLQGVSVLGDIGSIGFLVMGVAQMIQSESQLQLQKQLQDQAIAAEEKLLEKQHEHDKEMQDRYYAYEAAMQGAQGGIIPGELVEIEIDGKKVKGTYDEHGNFHLEDGSGYVDKDGNYHLADGSGYYDAEENFHYSDGTGYLDKDGKFHQSDGSGYFDKDGNFFPSDKSGYYDKEGNFFPSEDSSDNSDIGDENDYIEADGEDFNRHRRTSYGGYFEDDNIEDSVQVFRSKNHEPTVYSQSDRFEKFIENGIFTHKELQGIKENILAGRLNFSLIEYMYEELDLLTYEQAEASLEMLKYYTENGSL